MTKDIAAVGIGAGPHTRRRLEGAVRTAGIGIPAIVLFVVLAIASPSFATQGNLLNILDQQSAFLIIAAAGTLVMIAGGIDLSVGATYALCAVIGARIASEVSAPLGIVIGILVGLVIGLANGLVVTLFKINALITTLATSFIVGGAAALLTGGNIITLYNDPAYGALAQTQLLIAPSSTWIAIVLVVVIGIILARTTFGRYVYATGGNQSAARLAGVHTTGVRIATFVISGGAAALGGLIDSSRVLSAQSSVGGDALTFTVVAGIVVGGTSILGGEGAVWRTALGVLFIALIGNGFNLLGLDPLYQRITLGAIILIAVGSDALSRQRRR